MSCVLHIRLEIKEDAGHILPHAGSSKTDLSPAMECFRLQL